MSGGTPTFEIKSRVYTGKVVHKRLTPKHHAFKYSVFSLCLDVDEIDRLTSSLRFFSRNGWNLFSFHDRDHGNRDGSQVAVQARHLLGEAKMDAAGTRIELLCYPRLFGFVFNPLSVYFCYGADNQLGAIIYEVTNTFGERRSYVIAVADAVDGAVSQHCGKQLYVSPFTGNEGSYDFHVVAPSDRVVVGVAFRQSGVAVLKTYFTGARGPLSDWRIAALLIRYPLMTLKVVAGIHFEAARLWLKGIPPVKRHAATPYSFTVVPISPRDASHV